MIICEDPEAKDVFASEVELTLGRLIASENVKDRMAKERGKRIRNYKMKKLPAGLYNKVIVDKCGLMPKVLEELMQKLLPHFEGLLEFDDIFKLIAMEICGDASLYKNIKSR